MDEISAWALAGIIFLLCIGTWAVAWEAGYKQGRNDARRLMEEEE